MRGLQLVDRWNPGSGEPVAGLTKCLEGEGQKEVSCDGLRGRGLGADCAPRGMSVLGTLDGHPPMGRGLWTRTGTGWCLLMQGWYGQGSGTSCCCLQVLFSIQTPWQVQLQDTDI